jgi:hypothetical protein
MKIPDIEYRQRSGKEKKNISPRQKKRRIADHRKEEKSAKHARPAPLEHGLGSEPGGAISIHSPPSTVEEK